MRSPTAHARVARTRGWALVLALLGAAAVVALSTGALAQVIEPGRVHTVVVGTGGAGSERGGPRRTGLTDSPLPDAPVVRWRHSLSSPLETPPVVARDGRVAVVLSGSSEVRLFAADGAELGAVDLGGQAASVAPAFLGDGTLVVVTASGAACFIDRWGSVVARTPLGIRGPDALPPTATARGSVALVVGRQIVELDSTGRLLARGTLEDEIVAPLAIAQGASGGQQIVAVTGRGDVWLLRSPLAASKLGSLGGVAPGGVAVAADGALWAVVAGSVARVERRGRPTPWRANAASGVLAGRGPPALAQDGSVAFVGIDGSLVVMEPSGDVRFRVALDRTSPSGPAGSGGPGAPPRPASDDGPPLLIDAAGRIAFARSSGRVGVVAPDGRVSVVSERLCASPLGIAASPGGFVVGCAEGFLVGIGEADGAPAPSDDDADR